MNLTIFQSGDSILFAAGQTFNGNIYFSPSSYGSPSQPILLSSYGNGAATIYAGNGHGFLAYNSAGIDIRNLKFTGSGASTNTGTGVYFYLDLANNVALRHIMLENLDISGFRTSGIQISSWPTDQSRSGYRDITISACVAHDNGLSGISVSGYYNTIDTLYSHKNLHISKCIAHHNTGFTGMTSHSGNGIIIGQTDSCIIEYCEAYENGKNNNYAGGGPAGIWAWDSRHVIIQYSYAHHNRSQTLDGDGFDLDGGVQNSILQYNYAHDNDGPGFLIAQYTGARKMKNNIVRYNISERDGKGLGALIWSGDPAGTVTAEKIDFYNNTIYIDTTGNGFANAAIAVYNNYGAMKDIRICNNILIVKNKAALVDINKTMNLRFYNNVYYDHGDGYLFRDNGNDYNALTTWRNATQQEIYNGKNTGFRTNPNVFGAGNGGNILHPDSLITIKAYRLMNTSGIIGKGIVIDSLLGFKDLVFDFYGDSIWPNLQFTPGAHEISSPKASFTFNNHCMGQISNFKNNSTNALSYFWDFGDGASSYIKTPNHLYAKPGTYNVKLIVTGKFAYMDSLTKLIEIFALPKADFRINNICYKDSSQTINLCSNATSYLWKWGDSNISKEFQPTHFYPYPGTYSVRLIAFSKQSCIDSVMQISEVFNLPVANFMFENKCLSDSVTFKNTSTGGSEYHWNYGDSLISNTIEGRHRYRHAGFYQVHLKALSSQNCIDSMRKTIEIYQKPLSHFSVQNHCLGNPLPISNLNTTDSLYEWSAESGVFSNDTQARFTFSSSGNYRIKLKVTSKKGCTDTSSSTVQVNEKPNSKFTFQHQGHVFHFVAEDSTLSKYQWKHNDSILSVTKNKIDIKLTGKTAHIIRLITWNKNNCSDSFSVSVFDSTASIYTFSFKNDFLIYPNPFSDHFSIRSNYPINNETKWTIRNIQGQKIYEIQPIENPDGYYSFSVQQADYPLDKGIYFIETTIEGRVFMAKLIRE